jgi:hypothetical protein
MPIKFFIGVAITVGSMLLIPMPSRGVDAGSSLAKQALEQCHQGRLAKDRDKRLAHFQQGQRLGEQAVASDEGSADAHFALFCNLGELLRVDGESLTSLFGLRRMMHELGRALELNPAHIEAISAKGTLLIRLPGVLGGDIEKGEQLLQQVVKQAPKAVNARLALARVWCEHGRHNEAMVLASDALALARRHQQYEFIPEAQTLLQQAKAKAIKVKHHRS